MIVFLPLNDQFEDHINFEHLKEIGILLDYRFKTNKFFDNIIINNGLTKEISWQININSIIYG